ncbi:hypothetical protein [Qipengyuania soli]|uniref:hypothetical protein n=1 Tax=Qipengyuania soli TaxID=2782568 RepID=UPI001FE5CCD3|nr:hypothetical protein [Qipengyuania soli]
MDRRILSALALFAVTACSQPTEDSAPTQTVDLPGNADDGLPPPPPPVGGPPPMEGDATNDGYPDLTPAALTPEAERTVKGARNVLLSWARAIELREFDQAWGLMSDTDHAKWSKPAWARLFADLDKITVAVPDGTMEGAAGSSYYTSQASITGTDKDGRAVRYEGPVVLRRVNDVPGASAEQLRWHIDSVTLDWVH